MNEEEKVKEIKEEMAVREQPDSFSIKMGTPAKGPAIELKCYYDAAKIDEAQTKVENILKIRQYLIEKGIVVWESRTI